MTSKLQGYSTIGTNNKEAAEIFYDGLLAQINAKKFPANDRITMWMSEDGNSVILPLLFLMTVELPHMETVL